MDIIVVPGSDPEPQGGGQAWVGTRQMLVRMVANNLMMGVWGQGGQLAGMASLPASSCTGP